MSGVSGALAFLLTRSLRNRLGRQLKRLKTPRYAIAAIIGVAYIGFMVWSQTVSAAVRPGGPAPALGGFAALGVTVLVLLWWVGGRETSPLAFHPSEAQFLFQAPVTRRQLLLFKLAKTQFLLLLSCLIWGLLSNSWGVRLPGPLRLATIWAFFSVISVHHLGAALVQVRPLAGFRRPAAGALRVIAAVGLAVLALGVLRQVPMVRQAGFAEGLKLAAAALEHGPAGWVMAPFRLLVAPLFAPEPAAWLPRFGIVLAILAVHVAWVLVLRVPFEETAATVSGELAARIAAFRSRGGAGAATVKAPGRRGLRIPLAPAGHPAVAIAWKNVLAYWRMGSLRVVAIMLVPILVMSAILNGSDGGSSGAAALIPPITFLAMSLLVGPQAVRADLRQDLQSLGLIKTWPVTGTALVAAEMAAPVAMLTAFQLVMLAVVWVVAPPGVRELVTAPALLGAAAVAPFALLALNAAGIGIQNAIALMFPGWVRLGPDSGGVEVFGQRIMVTIGSMLLLVLALLVPLGAAAGLAALLTSSLGAGGAVIGAATGVILLGFEVAFMVVMLGELFERTDPAAVG